MAIISLVIQLLRQIVAAAPAVLASLAGFGCIQDFLLLKEVQSENNAKYLETGDASDDKIENQRDIMETHAVGTASEKPAPKGCVARFCSASIAPQGKPDKFVLQSSTSLLKMMNFSLSVAQQVVESLRFWSPYYMRRKQLLEAPWLKVAPKPTAARPLGLRMPQSKIILLAMKSSMKSGMTHL